MVWSKRWKQLFVAWLALAGLTFLSLEVVGMGCEMLGVPGCSTASYWMASNWGPLALSIATGAALGTATWHWWDTRWRQLHLKPRWLIIDLLAVVYWAGYLGWIFLLANYGVTHP